MANSDISPVPTGVADKHRWASATFTQVVTSVTDWQAPTPVAGWNAADVVHHLTTWLPGFLSANTGLSVSSGIDALSDPAGAWKAQEVAVQELLDDPQTRDLEFASEHVGPQTVGSCLDMIYTPDVFMHTWDLARSQGMAFELDESFASSLLAGMQSAEATIRASGHYGQAQSVTADAPIGLRLVAFIGRDPNWSPGN